MLLKRLNFHNDWVNDPILFLPDLKKDQKRRRRREKTWHALPPSSCLHSVGSFSISPASPSSWLPPHVTVHSVVPPDLPDNLFPLLSHLVQMVKLYGVACQSPFGRLDVTAGPMAREGPPTRAATGEKRRTWSWPKSQSGGGQEVEAGRLGLD